MCSLIETISKNIEASLILFGFLICLLSSCQMTLIVLVKILKHSKNDKSKSNS